MSKQFEASKIDESLTFRDSKEDGFEEIKRKTKKPKKKRVMSRGIGRVAVERLPCAWRSFFFLMLLKIFILKLLRHTDVHL